LKASSSASARRTIYEKVTVCLTALMRDRLSGLENEMERQQIVIAQERAKEILKNVQNLE
jgi:hypothetical protein